MFVLLVLSLAIQDLDSPGLHRSIIVTWEPPFHVIVSRSEHTLALADAEGRVVASYREKGRGPRDLYYPVYLGFHAGSFWVLSNFDQLVSFDNHLTPTARGHLQKPLADGDFAYGLKRDEQWLWFQRGMSRSNNLVSEVAYSSSGFTETQSFFQQGKAATGRSREQVTDNLAPHIHHQWLAVMPVAVDGDHYRINLYRHPSQEAPLLVLLGELAGFPPVLPTRPHHCFPEQFFAFRDGFLVTWRGKKRRTSNHVTTFVDVFSPTGAFRQREETDHQLIPCLNQPRMYVLVEGETKDRLKAFSDIQSWRTWLALAANTD